MSARPPNIERLYELLAERATDVLEPAQQAEIAALLAQFPEAREDDLDRAAAAVFLACDAERTSDLPSELRNKIEHLGQDWRNRSSMPPAAAAPAGRAPDEPGAVVARLATARAAWLGWVAAAACLIGAVVVYVNRPVGVGAAPVVARAADLEQMRLNPAVIRAAFQPGPDTTGTNVTGEMLWDDAQQRGYMVFKGLAPLDPARNCYQLWIFDPSRDERYPVHGGVFNADASTGELIVPVRSPLTIANPNLFVVTVEPPGGVWVSDRSRIAAIAKRG